MQSFTKVSFPHDGVALLSIGTEDGLNPLSIAGIKEIVDCLDRLSEQPEVRVVVLTGGERALAAGADISEMENLSLMEMKLKNQFRDWDRMAWFPKPLLAAVRGYALGGGFELALLCDMIFADPKATFGFPECKLGLMPGAGGTQRLARKIGAGKALSLLWTGDSVKAEEGFQLGFVDRVAQEGECLNETIDFAKRLAQGAPLAIRAIKEAVWHGIDIPLLAGMEMERNLFYQLFSSEDSREGMSAFREKRAPRFTGR
ncbi:enoyl-CoA hydratase-related protein [Alicyclobacillus tolerans]|uniref:enoyl-CoA hydratase-related protein n=1 Tax=Alicyclobacillus tolerans TaxID=90970 RepID=UPI003B7731E2